MGRCLGRAWACAAALLLTVDALLKPAFAYGQDDEVIVDPELAGETKPKSSAGGNGDEVIEDPELSGGTAKPAQDYGWGEVYKPKDGESQDAPPPATPAEEPDPMANTGIGKLEVVGQTAIDMHHEGNLEDFYEARLRFGGEVDFRLSRKLRVSLGTRIDFGWYAPWQGDPALKKQIVYGTGANEGEIVTKNYRALDQDRYELDIVPLSAYVDVTPKSGVHLRVGEQVVTLGRMDGISMTDMLAVLDFRPQARADPSGLKLAQPAVRLDWDMSTWATLQLVYVPWFMPHLARPNRDQYVGWATTAKPYNPNTVGADATDAEKRQAELDRLQGSALANSTNRLIDPSWQTRAGESVVRFVGPPPDFSHPQAEARVNFRGSTFEVALLGGTALEKLPAIYYAPIVREALLNENGKTILDAGAYMQKGFSVVDVEYHRYYQFGVDGSFDIAPVQVAFELAYSPERHLYTQSRDGSALPLPNVSTPILDPLDEVPSAMMPRVPSNVTKRSIRKGVPMLQAALHIEYLKGEELALIAEGYLFQAFARPYAQNRDWLGFGEKSGTYFAGLVGGSYSLVEGKYRFEATLLAMKDKSFMVTPQFEVQVVDGLYINIGAQIFEGPKPNNLGRQTDGRLGFTPGKAATNLTLGGVMSGYDNVYLGFRWVP